MFLLGHLASNSVAEVLGDNPSLQEILWNFSRFKDEKKCLTLSENPYFYAELPTPSGADGRSFRLDPTEDFQSANEFYVLTDRTGAIVLFGLDSFKKCWCLENAIIFKGMSILFFLPSSDVLTDNYGTLVGESTVSAFLTDREKSCSLCKRLWPEGFESTTPRGPRDHPAWQQITRRRCSQIPVVPQGCLIGGPGGPRTGFLKCVIDYPIIVRQREFPIDNAGYALLRVCICTGHWQGAEAPNSLVRCDIITY